MIHLIYLLVFGFLLTTCIGLAASWIDRKVTARIQYRVGPPLLQPLLDIVKLLGKETVLPSGVSRVTFLAAPMIGLASVMVVSTVLWVNSLYPSQGFVGDWIVALYLLAIPSLSVILGGFASRNPLAGLGASREMKLVLAYELPFVLAALVPVIEADCSIRLGDILNFQRANGATATSPAGALALLVAIVCMQAKLALVPFDIPEAETEILCGPLVEYGGPPLAIYRLMKDMLLFILPFFLIILFLGGVRCDGVHLFWGVLKYVGLLALITVGRNTNPRLRIDQALKFFWGPVTFISIGAVLLAAWGH